MDVWAVANQKGGVGKTTTVVSCGGLLADAGRRVLLVDLDPHGSLTAYFRLDPDTVERGSYDLFRSEQLPHDDELRALTVATAVPGLVLMPASTALATVEREFRSREGMGLRLARALARLGNEFDHVLIDTPPVLGILLVNALAAGERLLMPVQTDFLAIKGLERMANTLAMVVRSRRREMKYCVVPTMYEQGNDTSMRGLRALLTTFSESVADSVVPYDNAFREASARGLTPSQFAPFSRGVKAYRTLLCSLGALPEPALASVDAG